LAQFSRSSIVHDIASRMTAAFAQNLEARLNEIESGLSTSSHARAPAGELDAGSLVLSVLRERIRAFLRSVFRRGR
jgi:carbon-monoxide dehydrogenase small subunit